MAVCSIDSVVLIPAMQIHKLRLFIFCSFSPLSWWLSKLMAKLPYTQGVIWHKMPLTVCDNLVCLPWWTRYHIPDTEGSLPTCNLSTRRVTFEGVCLNRYHECFLILMLVRFFLKKQGKGEKKKIVQNKTDQMWNEPTYANLLMRTLL